MGGQEKFKAALAGVVLRSPIHTWRARRFTVQGVDIWSFLYNHMFKNQIKYINRLLHIIGDRKRNGKHLDSRNDHSLQLTIRL